MGNNRNKNILVQVTGPQQAPATYTTKVLKANMVNGVNILTQLDFTNPNTKYVIKWDFDLKGETIEIPRNCILEFDGGSISNGTIIMNDTQIIAYQDTSSFFKNVTLLGRYFSSREPKVIILPESEYINKPDDSFEEEAIYFIKGDI